MCIIKPENQISLLNLSWQSKAEWSDSFMTGILLITCPLILILSILSEHNQSSVFFSLWYIFSLLQIKNLEKINKQTVQGLSQLYRERFCNENERPRWQ